MKHFAANPRQEERMNKKILKKMGKIALRSLIVLLVTVAILVAGLWCAMYFTVNGPSPTAGKLLILSLKETSAAGFLADWFMTEEEIAAITADKSRHVLSWTMKTTVTEIERTYDYYWLDENRTLVTVNGAGEFYVLTSAVEKMIADAADVANGIKITAVSPYTNIDK